MYWVAGRLSSAEASEIAAHVTSCRRSCPEHEAICAAIADEVRSRPQHYRPNVRAGVEQTVRDIKAIDAEARRLETLPPARWADAFRGHPYATDLDFLFGLAEHAAYFADEHPEAVRAFAAEISSAAESLTVVDDPECRAQVRGLVALAEGVTWRTEGDHVAALAAYAKGETALKDYEVSEKDRLRLARGQSLRRLGRFDEAAALANEILDGPNLVYMGFEAKALWFLATIAWEAGKSRDALRYASQARRCFLEEGDRAQASIVLLVAVAALVDLGRLRVAGKILSSLEREVAVQQNPYMRGRFLWNRARVVAAQGDVERSRALMDEAIKTFSDAGAVLESAGVLLDRAEAAGTMGDVAEQVHAATAAIAILERIPGHRLDPDFSTGLGHLRDAIAKGVAVTDAIVALRRRTTAR
ncbi:MAG: hypothetical protein U0166_03015 [Acidobacteriota bacterium]